MNLCANAAHAMREEGGTLEVALQDKVLDVEGASKYPDLSPGPYLMLTVSDTGHGIEKNIIDQIFDPYFTTKEKEVGTGLGLSVVHGIVRSHGGAITVESEVGKGSTFQVLFPAIQSEIIEAEEDLGALPRGKERILFVDDEEALADSGKRMLERLGYEVVSKVSSREALETFRKQPERFDVVITDMTMPDMTGDKLAKELMNIRFDIPVILCTGYSERITEEMAKEMGINAFIMKPYVMRDFAATIRKVLDEKQS
jgi:CheY-like chemotaxis protein